MRTRWITTRRRVRFSLVATYTSSRIPTTRRVRSSSSGFAPSIWFATNRLLLSWVVCWSFPLEVAYQSSAAVKSGLKRLYLTLTLLSATFWAVVYPLHHQWMGQQEALDRYNGENKNCALLLDRPGWDARDCYEHSMEGFQNQLRFNSFKHFWMFPILHWKLFLPLILVLPMIVCGLVVLGIWVRNGFVPRTSH